MHATIHGYLRRAVTRAVLVSLIAAPVALAAPAVARDQDGERRSAVTFDAHQMEILDDNGQITVRLDGKEIPENRVRRTKGRIVILDEDGHEIRSIDADRLHFDIDNRDHGIELRFSDGDGHRWVVGDEDLHGAPDPEPTVMMGVHLGTPGPALERHLGLKHGTTTMITALYEGLPAREADLDEFDIITEIDGHRPADPKTLRKALAEKEPGDLVRLSVIHEGSPRTAQVKLRAFDREAMEEARLIGEDATAGGLFRVGPRSYGWQVGPNMKSLGDLDLRRFFLDDKNRIFEFFPRRDSTARGEDRDERERARDHDEDDDDENGEAMSDRLRRLDRRLDDLAAKLDALIEEAKKRHAPDD